MIGYMIRFFNSSSPHFIFTFFNDIISLVEIFIWKFSQALSGFVPLENYVGNVFSDDTTLVLVMPVS